MSKEELNAWVEKELKSIRSLENRRPFLLESETVEMYNGGIEVEVIA